MAERTKRELSKVYQDAMFKRHKEGDPDRTYVSDCQEAGQRACYELGASDARAALEAENAGLRARVEGLESELKTANHWRERHSRDAEAYGQQSAKNWKRVRELEEELRAALTPTTAGGTEKCGQCDGSGEEKLGLSAGNICTCRECHGTGRANAGGGVRT
jgi:DnaJ-class molecular chaperone